MSAECETVPEVSRIREACRRALWESAPAREETGPLLAELEGHIRLLAPRLAARVSRMDEETQQTALLVLCNVDQVLDERAPRADAAARLHDLGVVARAALTLLEQLGPPDTGGRQPADSRGPS